MFEDDKDMGDIEAAWAGSEAEPLGIHFVEVVGMPAIAFVHSVDGHVPRPAPLSPALLFARAAPMPVLLLDNVRAETTKRCRKSSGGMCAE